MGNGRGLVPVRPDEPLRSGRRGLSAALVVSALAHGLLGAAILVNLEAVLPEEPPPVEAVPIELVVEPPAPQPEAPEEAQEEAAAAEPPPPPPSPEPLPDEAAVDGEGSASRDDLAEALQAMPSVPVPSDVGTPTTFDGDAEATGEDEPADAPAEAEAADEPTEAETAETETAEAEPAETEAEPADTEPAESEPAEADPAETPAEAAAAAATGAEAAGAGGEPDGTELAPRVLATPGDETGEVAADLLADGEGASEAATGEDGDALDVALPRPKPERPVSNAARAERATVAYTQAFRSAISRPFFREMERLVSRNVSARGIALVEVVIRRDGSVAAVTLVQPSGNPGLDAAALGAAREARYPPFTPDMTGDTFAIRIPLRAF